MVVSCTSVDIQPKIVTQACCRFGCRNSFAHRRTVGKTDGYWPQPLIMSSSTCQPMQPPFAPFGIHSSLYKCNRKSTSYRQCVMEPCPLKQLYLREESSLRVMCVLCQGCKDWYSFISKGSETEVPYYYINYRNSPRLDGFLWRLPWQSFNRLTLKSLSWSYAMHGGWVIHTAIWSLSATKRRWQNYNFMRSELHRITMLF